MVSSSTLRWVGSVAVAGLLLVSSVPALATAQTKSATILPAKPLLVAANSISTGTYSQIVRKELQGITRHVNNINAGVISASGETVPAPNAPVTVAQKPSQPIIVAQATQVQKPSNNTSQPVKVASTAKQQVSRSENSGLVENALSLQGVPYVFGGTSRNGFDCSGYTQYVFKNSGSSLPRSSFEQFKTGSSVTRESLQSGDLVFFTTYSTGPSHVGIYIGGGKFVHASNTGVRVTSLSDSYYAGRYLGARRVN